ncbi:hypothetical protein WJX74_010755 [Apatococcus lobatus]|uniref:Nucleolar protein 14 n=1 Tax=Apatococcus lobatus TaxID=904363 RepID=A0AAW1QWF2_9CHLO
MVKRKAQVKPTFGNKAKTPKPNPFEQLHSRKKFDVLGRKSKGQTKALRSRSDANEKRKKSLLVEYRQMRSANAFVDRRFGEDDDTLSPEERALQRLQKQRTRQLSGSKFALGDEDADGEEELTHLGRSLAEADHYNDALAEEDGEDAEYDRLQDSLLQDFNFGGGLLQRKQPGTGAAEDTPEDAPDQRRSKKEVMEEVMAKSKAFKAVKQQQREEDLTATDALDAQFQELLEAGNAGLQFKAPGSRQDRPAPGSIEPQDAAYDRMRRELVFEAKAQGGERTKTAEEIAEDEKARLERLETERIKRMRGMSNGSDEDASGGEDGAAGGYRARRQKRKREEAAAVEHGPSGDALDDDFDVGSGSESGEGGSGEDIEDAGVEVLGMKAAKPMTKLEARRAARAAGDHPLAAGLRAASAKLLQKHGLAPTAQSLQDLEAAGEDESGSREDDDDSSGDSEDGSGEDLEASEEDVSKQQVHSASQAHQSGHDSFKKAGKPKLEAKANGHVKEKVAADESASESAGSSGGGRSSEEGATGSGDSSDEEDIDIVEDSKVAAAASSGAQDEKPDGISDGVPEAKRVKIIGSGDDMKDLTFSIPAPETHKDFLRLVDGRSNAALAEVVRRIRACNAIPLAAGNRRKIQVFFGILVQHFAMLASQHPVPTSRLDVLTAALASIVPEVPFYAATVARARLTQLHELLSTALNKPVAAIEGPLGTCWPPARHLLLLQLWSLLFPASDRRHQVMTPLAVTVGRCLSLCPLHRPADILSAIFLAGLHTTMACSAKRYAPEALTCVTRLLTTALPSGPGKGHPQSLLIPHEGWTGLSSAPLSLPALLNSPAGDPLFQESAFCGAATRAAIGMIEHMATSWSHLPAFPELFQQALSTLQSLSCSQGLPQELQAAACNAAAEVEAKCNVCVATRKPLIRYSVTQQPAVKQYTPRFEEDFARNKDYDPDRERAQQKRLQKEVNREKRGAMRELRRDAAFLGEERDKERQAHKAERKGVVRRNNAFLQQQEADFKSGGQGGMWKRKSKK